MAAAPKRRNVSNHGPCPGGSMYGRENWRAGAAVAKPRVRSCRTVGHNIKCGELISFFLIFLLSVYAC